ncbi:MAG: hypothetical protein P4L51_28380 [Puia sp.]|nr:hypothetical protein [Puia sp.]
MLFNQTNTQPRFRDWLLEDPENRRLGWLAAAVIVVQFLVFKFLYPFPNFMPPDSYSYLDSAFHNLSINMWAIGYSKFLRLFSSITSSHVAMVWFQYLLLELSILYFLFSMKYLFSPGKWLFRCLLAFSTLNPLIPHISNFVGSDTLFTALSLIWITQLCWIIYRPNTSLLFWHGLVVLAVFTVRYNALYYPVISIAVIILSPLRVKTKLAEVGYILVLIGGFIVSTEYHYYKETKTVQFSAFGGWQLAANALYGYAYAKPDPPDKVPEKFRNLQAIVNHHMDSIRPLYNRPDREVAVYYLWDFKSPLRLYLNSIWGNDTVTPYFNRWASVAPLYTDYGRYLILHHPEPFVRYYLWPNLIKYFVPPAGFMQTYNMGSNRVDSIALLWFKWKSNVLTHYTRDNKIRVVAIFSVLLAIVNLIFPLNAAAFVVVGGFRHSNPTVKYILGMMSIVWLCNLVFSVFSAPIELRYQLFPMIITCVLDGLFLSYLVAESTLKKANPEIPSSKIDILIRATTPIS